MPEVSEIRQDPTTKEWVIIASERRKRPVDFSHQQARPEEPAFSPSCPFCPGNEAMAPSPVLSFTDAKSGDWRVRVFPNRFPALTGTGTATRREEDSFFIGMDGIGVHEVVVETPAHNKQFALMEEAEIKHILRAYHDRYNALSRLPHVSLVIIFKNHGPSAGTSLRHPHSQIVATPIVPRHIRMQYEVAVRYYDDTGRCLHSDLASHELRIGKRILLDTERFVVFHPFASHRSFETWIVPKSHHGSFGDASDEDLDSLAAVLKGTLLKLYRGLNDPDFNYVIDTAPVGDENKNYYLWHMRIIPRLSEMAGFEIGTGIYINTALPEETAQFMRDLQI